MISDPELICEYGDRCRSTVPLIDGMTLADLRDVLFSLTDILPERLVIVLNSGTELEPSDHEDETDLGAVGIRPGDIVRVVDRETRPEKPSAESSAGAAACAVTLEQLAAALSNCRVVNAGSSDPPSRDVVEGTTQGEKYIKKLAGYYEAVMEYENEKLQQKARDVVPLDKLRAEAEQYNLGCPDAVLCKALLRWFKNDFFQWVNSPQCWACGGNSSCIGHIEPTICERKYRAGVVELHKCQSCEAVQRFPRFNDPAKLLETRRGRCGEWAQAFTLICVSVGLIARCVHDETDHVWTEIWSNKNACWMHADSCEASLNEPLLYESGWGKKLSYVVAVGKGSVADVTRRYTSKYAEVLTRRNLADESWLAAQLSRLHASALAALPPAERAAAISRHETDALSLTGGYEASASGESFNLPGRQSGSSDWIRQRGEDGDTDKDT